MLETNQGWKKYMSHKKDDRKYKGKMKGNVVEKLNQTICVIVDEEQY